MLLQGSRLLIARDQVLLLERVIQAIIKLFAAVAVANINLFLRGQCFDRTQRGGNPRKRGIVVWCSTSERTGSISKSASCVPGWKNRASDRPGNGGSSAMSQPEQIDDSGG